MNDLIPVKGTRDFFPREMRLRNWLFDLWRKSSLKAGFEEYDTCVLEHEDLYIRKAGDEISKQLYSFEDKGGRRLSLRPEMTPSLARLVVQQTKSLTFPINKLTLTAGLVVTEEEVKKTIITIAENLKIIVEPGGVVAAAAVIFKKINVRNKNVVVMISGGNIDFEIFSKL